MPKQNSQFKYSILVLNGPNLNMLGTRETDKYGVHTLQQLNTLLAQKAAAYSLAIECFQSNHEGTLIDKTHQAQDQADFLIINPAGYTHTSVAWRDAVLSIHKPFVEVHISNIFNREEFRHHSYFSDIAHGVITGLGIDGYLLALDYAYTFLQRKDKPHGY